MKASLLLAILGLSLLANTEGLTHRRARVQIVNRSGRNIQPGSIFIAHKYSDVYKNQLKFSKGLRNGEKDNGGGGSQIVDYNTGFLTTGKDWWYVTWVFEDNKAIYQTNPNNFRCYIDEIEKFGPDAISAAAAAVAGAASCGFPPVAGCAASPAAATGAAVAAGYISRSLLNNEATCGFKQYFLTSDDDKDSSPNTYLTITIKSNGQLTFSSPSGSAETVYEEIEIRPDGKVVIDKVKFSTTFAAAAARAYEVKTPSCAAMERGAGYLVQSVDSQSV